METRLLSADGQDLGVFFKITADGIDPGDQSWKRELECPLSLRSPGSALDGGFMERLRCIHVNAIFSHLGGPRNPSLG